MSSTLSRMEEAPLPIQFQVGGYLTAIDRCSCRYVSKKMRLMFGPEHELFLINQKNSSNCLRNAKQGFNLPGFVKWLGPHKAKINHLSRRTLSDYPENGGVFLDTDLSGLDVDITKERLDAFSTTFPRLQELQCFLLEPSFFKALGNFTSLRRIAASISADSIRWIPSQWLGKFYLIDLTVYSCDELVRFTSNFNTHATQLHSLKIGLINRHSYKIPILTERIKKMEICSYGPKSNVTIDVLPSALVSLRLFQVKIDALPSLPPTLRWLELRVVESLDTIDSLPPALRFLNCHYCEELTHLAFFPEGLTIVDLKCCPIRWMAPLPQSILSLRWIKLLCVPDHLPLNLKEFIFAGFDYMPWVITKPLPSTLEYCDLRHCELAGSPLRECHDLKVLGLRKINLDRPQLLPDHIVELCISSTLPQNLIPFPKDLKLLVCRRIPLENLDALPGSLLGLQVRYCPELREVTVPPKALFFISANCPKLVRLKLPRTLGGSEHSSEHKEGSLGDTSLFSDDSSLSTKINSLLPLNHLFLYNLRKKNQVIHA